MEIWAHGAHGLGRSVVFKDVFLDWFYVGVNSLLGVYLANEQTSSSGLGILGSVTI